MRTIVLMRGAPGCGKSTWIHDHGLSEYALSSDVIRGLYASFELRPDGTPAISQKNDKIVWETLFQMLERRMQRGDFTIIDACNSKTSEMKRYKELADRYRYRMYCIDMTEVPIEETLRRNRQRKASKIVPEEYIERVYSRFDTQQIPSGIRKIKPDEFESILAKAYDLSEYDRVVHIGDIHGCYDAIQAMFGEDPVRGVDPNAAYIFLGDYIDRGPDTPKVLQFLTEVSQYPNVCLLEGNHESHLWAWANDKKSRSREFEQRTKFQIEAAGIDKTDIRRLYRRMRQCSYYTWRGNTVMCTHGGLPSLSAVRYVDFIPSFQMITGAGRYEEMKECAASFEKYVNECGSEMYQVFGHRNLEHCATAVQPHSFVLENDVEHGGTLRVATLADGGWTFSEYASPIASELAAKQADVQKVESGNSGIIEALVKQMRLSPLIHEKQFGHISSFNFTRSAFNEKQWNDLTVRARGLYIDTVNNKIAARGYEKFFTVNERNETSLHTLSRNLVFPVDVYRKENGFLGLVSYDHATESLFVTTKSSPDGDMARLFSSMLSDEMKSKASEYLRDHDSTLLFEAVHPEFDPHIIEYDKPTLFLLDCVDNSMNFNAAPYEDLVEIAKALGVNVKSHVATLNNWDELLNLYNTSQHTMDSTSEPIEGYVVRDANGFMFKIKTDYYTTWKLLRAVSERVYNCGYTRNTAALSTPLMNYYYAFVKNYYADHKEHADIITLRKAYFRSQASEPRQEMQQ